MTEPSDPIPPAQEPAPPSPAAPAAPSAIAMPKLDAGTQAIVGSGVAVAVLALIGGLVGAWDLDFAGILMVVGGLVAAGAAYMTGSSMSTPAMPVAPRDVALAGALFSLVMGVLFVAEKLFDLDDLDDYGGMVGVLVTFLLAAAALALYLTVTGRWFGTLAGPWTSAVRSGRATQLVAIGTGLVIVGWLLNVTLGVWLAQAAALTIFLVVVAFALARASVDAKPSSTEQIVALITLAALAVAAFLAFDHLTRIIGEDVGADQVLFQIVVLGGVAVAISGVILWVLPLVAPKGTPD